MSRAEIVPIMAMALAVSKSPSPHTMDAKVGMGLEEFRDKSYYFMSKILGEIGGIKVDMDHVGSPGCQRTSPERVRCIVRLTEGCLIFKVVGSLSVGCWLSRLPTSSPP